jgi:hypothetical protein
MKTKQTKSQRPAAKPDYKITIRPTIKGQLEGLHKAQALPPKGSVGIRLTIPGQFYPMFAAMAAATQSPSMEAFAVWALLKGMVCEDALNTFDELVNAVL